MKIRSLLALATVLSLALVASLPAGAQTTFEQRSELLYISAGCPQNTPGTCTSTRWLGRTPGDSSSNFITAITPADEVTYQVNGTPNWRDYNADNSQRAEGYRLIGGSTIKVALTLTAQGAGAYVTVHARLRGAPMSGFQDLALGEQQQTLLTLSGTQTVNFDFKVPASLDGVTARSISFDTAVHGINVAAGYINQQGGSTVTIPHLVAVQS